MTAQLREAIARLRRDLSFCDDPISDISADVMLLCDSLEGYVNATKPKFDKVAYMREYMKKRRENAKKQSTSC